MTHHHDGSESPEGPVATPASEESTHAMHANPRKKTGLARLLKPRSLPAVATGILMLLVVGGGYAIAIANGGRQINACVHKRTHLVYTGKCTREATRS